MEKIEAVIFDMDGILFDTERIGFESYRKVLKKYGYDMNKEDYCSLIGRTRESISQILINKYGQDLPITNIYAEKDMDTLKFIYKNGPPIKPGVYELLDYLVEKEYKIAVATCTHRERAVALLERAGIRDKFNAIICGDDVKNSKPDPEIFLKAVEKLKVAPERCIVLEDSPVGIEAAHNGGMMSINIPDLKEPDEKVERLAYKICSNLLEVRDYLKNIDFKLFQLQNGTDIRGVAIEQPDFKANLTNEAVNAIASGFAVWLRNKKDIKTGSIKVAVGMDSRLSGESLKSSVIGGITSLGCDVYDCGMCTTPAMFMTTVLENYKCHGAIMITASHLPYYYNGLKFFTEDGGCEKEDIKDILTIAGKQDFNYLDIKGKVSKIDFIKEYSDLLIKLIRHGVNSDINYDKPLLGFKIVIDAGNGAGGFFAHKVLKSLGADTSGSQFTDPDGRFPNHIPNPENKEAMESIRDAVINNNADLGIIFDTDVDRAAIVGLNGIEINRNALIALISSIVLEEHPNSIIVTDSVTSTGLKEFIETKLGGIHHRFKRGYRNVINEALKLNSIGKECYLAIETSGHAALKENYFLDDGACLIAKILIKMAKLHGQGKTIESLIEGLKVPYESSEYRIKILAEDFKEYGAVILNDLIELVRKEKSWSLVPNNFEGIRVSCNTENGTGWFLLRLSLHEPTLPLNVESDVKGGVQTILNKLKPFLKKYDKLDISNLRY
ncbi:HAD-IA family hydrolase [Desnuesiella massiliensis]|uniref:HAD-IA family hydrolase n=1 Tax=Desnuesiella massiliensis TaxID=1650662 RepID=UPI0009E7E062|nr:HAD-IA family hydrolase [Desnuesiella massiliensis]